MSRRSRESDWSIVVPVRGTVGAKSRLNASEQLALAIAMDTVTAALSVAGDIVVVTSTHACPVFDMLGARVVRDEGLGLNAAVAAGVAATKGAVAVMLGDLPALRSAELDAALSLAASYPRAMVPDADGTGTVLLTAQNSRDHAPRFGPGSRAAHINAGYVELELPQESGLRRDVDTPAHLHLWTDRLGPHTASVLSIEPPCWPSSS
jgi:2-phospho-L-lactate guanylyltransferase